MGTEAGLALIVDPAKAIAALGKFDKAIQSSANTVTSFAGRVKRDFEMVGHAAGFILKPLTAIVGVAAAVKATLLATGVAAVKTAGDFEMLRQQLQTALGSKALADKAFRESLALASKSPFSAKEIVQVRSELEAVGVKGTRAVKSVAEAAAAMGRQIGDVAAAVKSLETEPLRRLGIQLNREGDEFVFRFRDRMGEAQRVVIRGFEEAQKALLGIFDEKFEGGIGRMSMTLKGLLSNLGDALDAIRSAFGEGVLVQAKLIVNDMIRGIETITEDARAAGVAFGKEIEKARINLLAGFDVAMQIAKEIRQNMASEDGGGIGSVILEALKVGAKVLGDGILIAFKASVSLWKLIGTIIGEGVLQAVYQSNIPGAGMAREYAIKRNLQGMDAAGLKSLASQLGVPYTYQEQRMVSGEQVNAYGEVVGGAQYRPVLRPKTTDMLARDLIDSIKNLPPEDQLPYAQLGAVGAANIDRAWGEAQGTLGEFKALLDRSRGYTMQALGNLGVGIDIDAAYAASKQRIQGQSQRQLGIWDRALSGGEGASVLGTAKGMGYGAADWLTGGMIGQLRGAGAWVADYSGKSTQAAGIGAGVAGQYAEHLRNEVAAARLSREEGEKYLVVQQAIAEAKREQTDAGLPAIGLMERERQELEKLIDDLHKAEKLTRIGNEIGYGFARGMQQATMHSRSLKDALQALGDAAMNVLDRVMEITLWEPMAQNISRVATKGLTKSAMGNVFMAGNVVPFANGGIFPGPTMFPMSGGRWALAGEAGLEAAVPLKRLSNGRLGVETDGRQGSPDVSIHIENNSRAEVEATPANVRLDGNRLLVGMILKDKRNNGPISRANRARG